jgi:hypothetical protein
VPTGRAFDCGLLFFGNRVMDVLQEILYLVSIYLMAFCLLVNAVKAILYFFNKNNLIIFLSNINAYVGILFMATGVLFFIVEFFNWLF